jgi:hypothetical protein
MSFMFLIKLVDLTLRPERDDYRSFGMKVRVQVQGLSRA